MSEDTINKVLDVPVMEVYAISNGFLLVIQREPQIQLGVMPVPLIVFAKDEVGIAEEIIAAQARYKLDVEPKQGEMFEAKQMSSGELLEH